jgi:hypothetical protein
MINVLNSLKGINIAEYAGKIAYYASNMNFKSILYALLPFAFLLMLTTTVILSLYKKNIENKDPRIVFFIHKTIFLAIMSIGACVIFYSIWRWNSDYYIENQSQFTYIAILFILFAANAISFYHLKELFRKDCFAEIGGLQITSNSFDVFWNNTLNLFESIKWWSLLPFLGFLLMFFPPKEKIDLVNIVLDNSDTMEEEINMGKLVLKKTLGELKEGTVVNITTFTTPKNIRTFNDLISINDENAVGGISKTFSDMIDATDYLDQISVGGDSPICEAIWKSYLISSKTYPINQSNINNRLLIIVTDGEENGINSELSSFFCESSDFNNFFTSDKVFVFYVGEQLRLDFESVVRNCFYNIKDGSNEGSYLRSISEALRGAEKRDIYFPITLFLLCCLHALIIFTHNPQK